MLAESRMMVPDCRRRLEAALADLKAILVCASNVEIFTSMPLQDHLLTV